MSEITSVLCRLCLKESFTLHNIYSSHTTSGDLVYRVLNYVYDLDITTDDGLLTQICAPCMWKMLEFEGYKRNVHFARVEIVKLLRQLRHASTGGCGSRESDKGPFESDSAEKVLSSEDTEPRQEEGEQLSNIVDEMQLLPGEELTQEESDLILDKEDVNQVPIKEEIDIVEWKMPSDTVITPEATQQFQEIIKNDCSDYESVDLVQTNEIEIEEWQMPKELKREPMNFESTGSSDSKISLRLEASEETVTLFEGESICTTENNSFVIRDANEGINEEDSRDEVVPEEETTSVELSQSILNYTESEMSHLKAPLSKRKSGFICDICKKGFKSKRELGNHVRIHNDERLFSCTICKKKFKQDTVRNVHELRHLRDKIAKSKQGSKKTQYSCGVCAKNFSSVKVLSAHSNLHSDKFKCHYCGKSFGSNAHLRIHSSIHSKEKPFKCEICSKCFTQKSNLNAHLHIHSSEKSFSCDICDKRFKSKQEKTVHALYHLRKE